MKKKVVIICGRENLSADLDFKDRITHLLHAMQFQIIHEPSSGKVCIQKGFIFTAFKIIVFGFILKYLIRPRLLIFNRYVSQLSVAWRTEQLRILLSSMDLDQMELYLIGRSAGALVATQLALEFPVKAVIALGYPFVHPTYGSQKHRIDHLLTYPKPLIIMQGAQDEYGNSFQISQIPMSSFVQVNYLDTNHDFILDDREWGRFVSLIQRYLS